MSVVESTKLIELIKWQLCDRFTLCTDGHTLLMICRAGLHTCLLSCCIYIWILVAQVSTSLPALMRRSPSTRTLAPPSTAWGTSSARTSTGRTCAWWDFNHIWWTHRLVWRFVRLVFVFQSLRHRNLSLILFPQAALRRASAILKSQKPVVVKKKRTRAAKTA